MKYLHSFPILFILFGLTFGNASAQPSNARTQKVTEFGNIGADNEMAYLELLVKSLNESPNARGCIIGYSPQRFPPGLFLRKLYGYQNYLVNSRGIDPRRIIIVRGGIRDRITTELWLVPERVAVPTLGSEFTFTSSEPLRFDTAYPDCPSQVSITLEELDDHLRFYAEALRVHPNIRSRIIVYPGRRSNLRRAAEMALNTRRLLIRQYRIDAWRIMARARNRHRECSEIELWIVPAGTVSARATHNIGRQRTCN
ncbi:MAG: hypothetical protein LC803_19005 [Acidobacteria bacterium]|nr:hypothetical protein [Acidobacteriota bacterium]